MKLCSCCCCCRFLTAGLLFLTLSYVGMVVLLKYFLPRDCLEDNVVDDDVEGGDEESESNCYTEGVDNTILNWSSDFFVSFFCFCYAFHLALVRTRVHKSAILVQVFMGGAFVLMGIDNWMYPNSGLDDNQGLLGYWVVWIGSSVFFTISGLGMAQFALSVTRNLNPVRFNMCWATSSLDLPGTCFPHRYIIAFCEVLLVASLSVFVTGGVWCSVSSELHVSTVLDDAEPTTTTADINTCFRLMDYGDLALQVSYALLWLPVGLLLRAAAMQWPVTILGLPTHLAAGTGILLQWSVGSMYPFYLMVTVWIRDGDGDAGETFFQLWHRVYGTVVYHWGMLLTFYCLHNLAYGLPEGVIVEDKPSPWSMEWFLCKIGFGPENDPTNKKRVEKGVKEETNSNKNHNESQKSLSSEEEEIDGVREERAM
ncbi:hypothetical protein IV203_019027 [Nitzschia inconspicua]|uniref:Transmembrane protein n=1 Tax=Nitzschia inconspicua TaxID=303405 RepID=A0A9K3LY50_9STRA|nr:hypothetical protein IV203_022649 [Nitzschia inconspicua]KAG7370457.1 hypothetical protein IV203_019027 [Nitzschia inconspicua]